MKNSLHRYQAYRKLWLPVLTGGQRFVLCNGTESKLPAWSVVKRCIVYYIFVFYAVKLAVQLFIVGQVTPHNSYTYNLFLKSY